MIFYKSSTFDRQLSRLTKKQKDGYSSCKNDIHNFFKNKKLNTLWGYRNTEKNISNTIKLKKTRLANSYLKIGSSGGFRLISVIDIQKETVTLIYIYPKTGKYGQDNYINERKNILSVYANELTNNKLTIFD